MVGLILIYKLISLAGEGGRVELALILQVDQLD
jgi:hypothetical protein